jgi:hypothetical protein
LTTETASDRGARPVALIGVLIGAFGFAAALTCLYLGMRDLMVNSGGFCASGGPYQINPGQQCESGQIWLLFGGVLLGLVFAFVLVGASSAYGGIKLSGVGLLLWAALFGALGWNFISLGLDPPSNMSGATGWIVSGVVFWLMALGGLIPGVMALVAYFRDSAHPERAKSTFDAPLVRANVSFVRSTPGDPAFGQTDPAATPEGAPGPAVPRTTGSDTSFVDPVTGERHGGGGDG